MLLVTHELDEAEPLCDRVLAMRAGRVLDPGAPGELIYRHGQARIGFTFLPAGALGQFRGLDGVEDVPAGRVAIIRRPPHIAFVGAALVVPPIPADLSVQVAAWRARWWSCSTADSNPAASAIPPAN